MKTQNSSDPTRISQNLLIHNCNASLSDGAAAPPLTGDGAVLGQPLPAPVVQLLLGGGPLQGRVEAQVREAPRGNLPPRRAASRHPGTKLADAAVGRQKWKRKLSGLYDKAALDL